MRFLSIHNYIFHILTLIYIVKIYKYMNNVCKYAIMLKSCKKIRKEYVFFSFINNIKKKIFLF